METGEIKILAVDDEEDILNLLSYNLKKAGFQVVTAEDGPEALEIAKRESPELILLDIMLPNMEGTEVLKKLKADEVTERIPVIMLTAKGEEVDRIVGFELGADDYITKPFSPRELILRVKAIFKRADGGKSRARPLAGTKPETALPARPSEAPEGGIGEADSPLVFGRLKVDLARHRVFVGTEKIDLTVRELRLLEELISAGGRVLSRDTLLDRAWGRDYFVTPRTVDTHIRRLREKLGSAAPLIETVRGAGYRFAAGD